MYYVRTTLKNLPADTIASSPGVARGRAGALGRHLAGRGKAAGASCWRARSVSELAARSACVRACGGGPGSRPAGWIGVSRELATRDCMVRVVDRIIGRAGQVQGDSEIERVKEGPGPRGISWPNTVHMLVHTRNSCRRLCLCTCTCMQSLFSVCLLFCHQKRKGLFDFAPEQ